MSRRRHLPLTSLLATVFAGLLLVGCSGAGNPGATDSTTGGPTDAGGTGSASTAPSGTADPGDGGATALTVGLTYVPDIQFAPFYVADALGYYEDAGLEVELRHHGANEALFAAIQQGAEDVVVASGDEVLAQRAAGGELTQIATLYGTSPVALIAPTALELTDPADLAGLEIGVPGEYGATYLGLLMLLSQGGLTPQDVRITSIGYTQTTALVTDEVDAVMGYLNGDAVRISQAGIPVTTMEPGDLVSVGIAANDSTLEADRAALESFVAATLRGLAEVVADPANAVELSADYIPGMTADARADALAVLEATVPLLSETGQTDAAQWQGMAEAMLAAGMIQAVPEGGFQNLAP